MYEVPDGDELREFLKKHNLTGAAAASIVGVDARTVRRWTASIEAENRRPIPWSAWQLLQMATGEKSSSSLYPMAEEKKKYFDEKSHQIYPETLEAFGVSISSRYGKADEIIDMIHFTSEIAVLGFRKYIKSIFYDSKATICNIEIHEQLAKDDDAIDVLYNIAAKHIRQFTMLDREYYVGEDLITDSGA